MKPPLRTKSVGTKVSEAEFALLEERARGAGTDALGVGSGGVAGRAGGAGRGRADSGEVALAEVLALRSLFLNLHFRAAKGEPVTEAEMRGPDRAGGRGEDASGRGSGWRRCGRRPAKRTSETAAEPQPEEG